MVSMHISCGSAREGSRHRESQVASAALAMGLAGLIGLASVGRSHAQSRSESSSPKPASSQGSMPAPRILNDDDVKRVEVMEKTILELRKKGQFAEAIAPAQQILTIRARAQGEDHWETADARRQLEGLAKISAMAPEARASLASAERIAAEGDVLFERGEPLKARPLRDEASELFRRILGEDHEKTAVSEEKRGYNLYRLGLSAEAEPILRKARTSLIRVLGEDHPAVARVSHELGYCLDALRKHDEAGPLFEQACQIWMKTRGEDHPDTANGYDGVANHLKTLLAEHHCNFMRHDEVLAG